MSLSEREARRTARYNRRSRIIATMFRLQARIGVRLVALLAALAPATAKANDAAFGGAGASLEPKGSGIKGVRVD